MKLNSPFFISSRLMAAVEVAGAVLQLGISKYPGDGQRTRYVSIIDLPDNDSHESHGMQSGQFLGTLQEGFVSLLTFLEACGESIAYEQRTGREGSNTHLFPAEVGKWAYENLDEISALRMEIEENKELIEE